MAFEDVPWNKFRVTKLMSNLSQDVHTNTKLINVLWMWQAKRFLKGFSVHPFISVGLSYSLVKSWRLKKEHFMLKWLQCHSVQQCLCSKCIFPQTPWGKPFQSVGHSHPELYWKMEYLFCHSSLQNKIYNCLQSDQLVKGQIFTFST